MKTNGSEHRSETVRGVSQLTFDAVEQMTKIVETMHSNISAGAPPIGQGTDGRTRGITGFVYSSIRVANRLTGSALDLALNLALGQLEGRTEGSLPQPQADMLISVVNGVLGDHLISSENPLAIEMELRQDGRAIPLTRGALARALPEAGGKILIAIHGSCMNDRQWRRNDHDHCAALAADLDYTNLYLRYNSGRHISENGREFAELLEDLIETWPVPVTELSVLLALRKSDRRRRLGFPNLISRSTTAATTGTSSAIWTSTRDYAIGFARPFSARATSVTEST